MVEVKIEHELKALYVRVDRKEYKIDPKKGRDVINKLKENHSPFTKCGHDKNCHQHADYILCDKCAKEIIKLIKGMKNG